MRPRFALPALACALAAVLVAPLSAAETDRSSAIRQVAPGETVAERSNAGLDQISSIAAGRTSGVDQIDPSLEARAAPETSGDGLSNDQIGAPGAACVLSPEQQAIVTSLQSQGRIPAGDCEMLAWFGQPGGQSESDDRRSLAEAVISTSPELLGQEAEAARLARLEAERRQAEAAAAGAIAAVILTPAPPVSPGN